MPIRTSYGTRATTTFQGFGPEKCRVGPYPRGPRYRATVDRAREGRRLRAGQAAAQAALSYGAVTAHVPWAAKLSPAVAVTGLLYAMFSPYLVAIVGPPALLHVFPSGS